MEQTLPFLIEILIKEGSATDGKTWKKYGEILCDYFGFLEAANLSWNQPVGMAEISPLAHYRTWCIRHCQNQQQTINQKINLISRLYLWAKRQSLIEELPFRYTKTQAPRGKEQFFHHTIDPTKANSRNSLTLDTPKKPIKCLSRNQIETLLKATTNSTHKCAIYLGLTTGLRAEEIATFPASYVNESLISGTPARIELHPSDMAVKFNKPRTINISKQCIERLWQYKNSTRQKLLARTNKSSPELLINQYGVAFCADGLAAPLRRLGQKIGFHIHPHMLRHTYSVHTYLRLTDLKKQGLYKGDPLLFLMEQLGHSSILTTMRYLEYINQIDDVFSIEYQREIDTVLSELYNEP
ncbi:tyrosine-type recombinase/integrase [Pseudomonas aeruginosa]